MAVEIQKKLCGVRNTKNLIDFTCFHLKISQVNVFWNFSRVCMFYDDNNSKLAPESMQTGVFPSCKIVDNLNEKLKIEHLIMEQRVWCLASICRIIIICRIISISWISTWISTCFYTSTSISWKFSIYWKYHYCIIFSYPANASMRMSDKNM